MSYCAAGAAQRAAEAPAANWDLRPDKDTALALLQEPPIHDGPNQAQSSQGI